MAEFNHQTQFVCRLGSLKMEIGYWADPTAAIGFATGDLSETHCIPTTLDTVLAGWIYCNSSPGGVIGGITGAGPVTRDFSGSAVPTDASDVTGASMVCFSLDASSELSDDYYMLIGW